MIIYMYWQFANKFIYDGTEVSLAVPKVTNIIIKGIVLYIFVLIFNFVLKEIMRLNRWQTAFGVILLTLVVIIYYLQIIHNVYNYVNPTIVTVTFGITIVLYTTIGIILCAKPSVIFGKKDENEFRDYVNDRLSKIESQIIAKNKEMSELNMSSRANILGGMLENQSTSGNIKDSGFSIFRRFNDIVDAAGINFDIMKQRKPDGSNTGAIVRSTGDLITKAGGYTSELVKGIYEKIP